MIVRDHAPLSQISNTLPNLRIGFVTCLARFSPRNHHTKGKQKATSARVHSHPWVEMRRPRLDNGWDTMSGSCPDSYTLYHLPCYMTNNSGLSRTIETRRYASASVCLSWACRRPLRMVWKRTNYNVILSGAKDLVFLIIVIPLPKQRDSSSLCSSEWH